MICFRYKNVGGKSACLVYSTETIEELEEWVRSHGRRPSQIVKGDEPIPYFNMGSTSSKGRPVNDNEYKRHCKEWKKRQRQGEAEDEDAFDAEWKKELAKEMLEKLPPAQPPSRKEAPVTVPTERIEIAQVIEGHDMYLELRKGKATVRFNKQEAVMVARLLEANAGILPDSPAPEE